MKHFTKIMNLHVEGLVAALDAHPELWDANRLRKDAPGTPHSGMSDIWLRYNDIAPYAEKGDLTGFNDKHVPVWYPAYDVLRQHVRPLLTQLMACFQGEMLGGVLITRIAPGAGIDPHTDKSWHVDYFEKLYVTLKSAPGAVFWCDHDGTREGLSPRPGEVWLFDNHKNHWVVNDSSEDRVTLIVCIRRLK